MSWHMWIFNPLWQEYHWIWKWQESQSLAQTRTHHQWLYNGLERTTFSLSLNQCTQHVELWETELNVPTEAELSVFAQEGPGYIVDSKTACNWREAELGQIWECRMKSAGGNGRMAWRSVRSVFSLFLFPQMLESDPQQEEKRVSHWIL